MLTNETNEKSQIQHNSQYLTIVQDPYPPINCSPDIFDPQNSCFSNQISMMDCINVEDYKTLTNIESDHIKKENLFS